MSKKSTSRDDVERCFPLIVYNSYKTNYKAILHYMQILQDYTFQASSAVTCEHMLQVPACDIRQPADSLHFCGRPIRHFPSGEKTGHM